MASKLYSNMQTQHYREQKPAMSLKVNVCCEQLPPPASGSVGSVRISRCISRLPGGHPKLFLYVSAFALLSVRMIPLIVAPVVILMNTKAAETHEQPLCYIPDQINTPAWMHSSADKAGLRNLCVTSQHVLFLSDGLKYFLHVS